MLVIVFNFNASDLSWTKNQLALANTAKDIAYLTNGEKEAIKYINLARLYPQLFEKIELGINGIGPINTEYKKSLVKTLKSMKPVKALSFDKNLYESAKCFATESGENGTNEHERIANSPCSLNAAECCGYGYSDNGGRDYALLWLIDEGVSSLGHRKTCLGSSYSKIGINFHLHKENGMCAVAQFR